MGRDDTMTPREVEGLIAEGQTLVIFEDAILRLDSFLPKHPGGRLAVMHMVGKDATDEIKAYHSQATVKTMKAYRIARKPAGLWTNMTPPIRGGIYRKLGSSLATTKGTDIIEGSECPVDTDDDDAASQSSDPSDPSDRSFATSLTSECSSIDSIEKKAAISGLQSGIRRRTPANQGKRIASEPTVGQQLPNHASLTPAEYVEWAMQQDLEQDIEEYPSIEPAVQQDIVRKYRLLHQRVQDAGLYDCPYWDYAKEAARYTTLFMAFLFTLRSGWYMTSACCLGLFWHQLMFTAHDAGHRAITHIFEVDTMIGMFIADFCCGLSIGWWKSSHNVHHLITNDPEHDPDIQNLPLFATCPSFFKSVHSSYYDFTFVWDAAAEFLIPFQKYTYYPVMGVARFNLYFLSWCHVLSSKSSGLGGSKAWWIRPTEIVFMACYWFLFGYCLVLRTLPTWTIRVAFVLVSHIITMPLHVQITLSHWGMPTTDLGESESFAQRQLRTTMDVDCPAWLDFIHGGLQFQAVHHLFPRVPRHNLRKVQVMVREFSKDTGIPYSILGFTDGNRQVLNRLEEVGDQVKILLECQKYMAETGESGLH